MELGSRRAAQSEKCEVKLSGRPAQAGQRGDRAADQALAAVPGRAHVRPRPGPRTQPVMELLRSLADAGRTVVVVTHSVANLDVCDRLLVLVPGGKVAFFGPPQRGAEVLRPARLGRGVPGLRPVSGPGLGRRVRRAHRSMRSTSPGRRLFRAVSGGPKAAGTPATGPRAARCRQAGHAVPPVRAGHRGRPRLPGCSSACCRSSSGALIRLVAGKQGLGGPLGTNTGAQDTADPAASSASAWPATGQLGPGAGQGTDRSTCGNARPACPPGPTCAPS